MGKSNGSEQKISVRSLVEFLLRSGDIDNRRGAGLADTEAMQMGSRLHRRIQKRMGSNYRAEVPLSGFFPCDDFVICVEGRADGILTDEEGVLIDEIKGIMRSVDLLEEPVPVHLAQAKCYAYLYGLMNGKYDSIRVRMTYANLETEEIRYFRFRYTYEELEQWFLPILEEYKKWARFEREWYKIRQASIRETVFPFSYREGQKDLAAAVYRSIAREKMLFIQAPTGTGKTLSTVFPAVKALGEEKGERIFYLTARTIARTVAAEAFDQLRGCGLRMKSVILTAKEKICPMEETLCNPEDCPYAKGHFDRINDAVFALIAGKDVFDREGILAAARQYTVCPFELSLDLSTWMDAVICDYNYVFAPRAKLRRFFGEGIRGDYIFLIDEAHNLVERGREMYSAQLIKEDFLTVKRALKGVTAGSASSHGTGQKLSRALEKCNRALLEMKRELSDPPVLSVLSEPAFAGSPFPGTLSAGSLPAASSLQEEAADPERTGPGKDAEKGPEKIESIRPRRGEPWRVKRDLGTFPVALLNLSGIMEEFLDEGAEAEITDPVRDLYFQVLSFLDVLGHAGEDYLTYTELLPDGKFMLRQYCVDPSVSLQECMDKARSAVLFSATLLPIDYYRSLLSTRDDNYAVYAKTCFPPDRLQVFIGRDTSSRYSRRNDDEYRRIARYIRAAAASRKGNYMVFFSSYRMLESTGQFLEEMLPDGYDLLCQHSSMRENEREEFLEAFRGDRERGLIGMCVMGSIFGEGIDLKGDRLIGVIIVGTGLPMVCTQQEILRQYYENRGEDGFRFAYLCPGMNKVMQAAGRVIRTEEDQGVALLLDERFTRQEYRSMFPREWEGYSICTLKDAEDHLKSFWKN